MKFTREQQKEIVNWVCFLFSFGLMVVWAIVALLTSDQVMDDAFAIMSIIYWAYMLFMGITEGANKFFKPKEDKKETTEKVINKNEQKQRRR